MAKKPIGISENQEKSPVKRKAKKEIVTFVVASSEPLDSESFIAGCNERGSTSTRFKTKAEDCNPVPPFTLEGLAHLASLLSDKNTASGGVERPHLKPEEPKRWAMGFLSHFNPQGECKIKDAGFIEKFARQVVAGEDHYQK